MSFRATLLTLLALVVSAALVFQFFQRQLSGAWFAFGVHPDVLALIERSLDDQKRLARLDPQNGSAYRRRFEEVQALQTRFKILEYNRQEIVDRYEHTLLGLVSGIVVLAGAVYAFRQMRQERRLMARDRRRLASLENLSAWQDAARRHAHEMRTPLTAARLELGRLTELAEGAPPESRKELARLQESVLQDLERLGRFTQGFTSFARLPQPKPERRDLGALAGEFVDLFAGAWPVLFLELSPPEKTFEAAVDPEMLRQVLVNLCDNSALAIREKGSGKGKVVFSLTPFEEGTALDVADDGPGVPAEVLPRLFEPYTTSRRIGEGMGLGLAISRKVMLDHGGDLELLRSSDEGTVFRLVFPRRETGGGG